MIQWISYANIHLRSYAQQNPLRDYQNEGHELFDLMMQAIEEDTSKYILKSVIQVDEQVEREKQQILVRHNTYLLKMAKKKQKQPIVKGEKLDVMILVLVVVVKI